MRQIERIIEQIISSPETIDEKHLANRLLEQFYRGASLEYLQPLLCSTDPHIASAGAWIASELGATGKPLLDVVATLLGHEDRRVRFWLIDCVLLWAEPSNGRELSRVVRMIDDREKAVRWKTMIFLTRASTLQLEAALEWLMIEESESRIVLGLQWLLGSRACDVEAVEAMLQDSESLMRKYAAAAAGRMAAKTRQPLISAASSTDSEVAEFAADFAP